MTEIIDTINNSIGTFINNYSDCYKPSSDNIDWSVTFLKGKINNCKIRVNQSISTSDSNNIQNYTENQINCIFEFFKNKSISSEQLQYFSNYLKSRLQIVMKPYMTSLNNSTNINNSIQSIINLFIGNQKSINCSQGTQQTYHDNQSDQYTTADSILKNFCNFNDKGSQTNFQYIGIENCQNSTFDNINQTIVYNFVNSVLKNQLLLQHISNLQNVISETKITNKLTTKKNYAVYITIAILSLLIIILIAIYFKSLS